MISVKIGAIIAAAFIAGAFVASPQLRAYAAATIGSADIIDGSIQSVDIGTSQVKAADIAPDAVGGSELIGVTKILYGQCKISATSASLNVPAGSIIGIPCNISGVDSDDSVIATLNANNMPCFEIQSAPAETGAVGVYLRNECPGTQHVEAGKMISIIVFDK
jgi:hypothetical protein